ncbi:hypothetical protein LINPERHAP1_LOCUS26700 [Linum perenne]
MLLSSGGRTSIGLGLSGIALLSARP